MLVVPHAWDQPDHAQRVVRLGIGRTLPKRRYTPERAAAELKYLLDNPSYLERAGRVAEQVRQGTARSPRAMPWNMCCRRNGDNARA
jgi:UDP:flavonoid glycosyltransferase YjiC (YdhE family)